MVKPLPDGHWNPEATVQFLVESVAAELFLATRCVPGFKAIDVIVLQEKNKNRKILNLLFLTLARLLYLFENRLIATRPNICLNKYTPLT